MSHVHSNFCLTSAAPITSKPRNHHHHHHHHHLQLPLSPPNSKTVSRKRGITFRASLENPLPPISLDQTNPFHSATLISASDIVRNFYGGINHHDLASVEPLIAPNCVYEDLVFPRPFAGRKSILEFFGMFIDYVSTDLQFVIDAISEEDSSAVGVTWHLEWKGRPFPFSKGCSFYQLGIVNGIRQIIYARDSVEPAIKPGESALGVTQVNTSLNINSSPSIETWKALSKAISLLDPVRHKLLVDCYQRYFLAPAAIPEACRVDMIDG